MDKKGFKIRKGVLKQYVGSSPDVIIPDTVTTIGEQAFEGCSFLTSVSIPNSVTVIEYAAFRGCSSLINENKTA